MLGFYCRHCGQHITTDDDVAGMAADCPVCEKEVLIPELPSGTVAEAFSQFERVHPTVLGPPVPRPGLYYGIGTCEDIELPAPPEEIVVWKPVTAGIIAAAVCLGMGWAFSMPDYPDPATVIGWFLGCTALAVVIAVIGAFIRKGRGKQLEVSMARIYTFAAPLTALLVLVGQLTVGPLKSKFGEEARNREQMAHFETDIEADLQEFADLAVRPGLTSADFPKISKGDPTTTVGQVRNAVNGLMADLLNSQVSYEREMRFSKVSRVIDPLRVQKDTNLRESRSIIRDAREIMTRFRASQDQLLADFPKRLEKIDVKGEMAGFIRGYQTALDKKKAQADLSWNYRFDMADRWSEIIDLLDSSRGHWTVQAGNFVFDQTGDLQRFKSILGKIREISDQGNQDLKDRLARSGVNME